ncbi:MAG: hypothetical protein ACKOW3_01270 [Hyphomicrobium sp.]
MNKTANKRINPSFSNLCYSTNCQTKTARHAAGPLTYKGGTALDTYESTSYKPVTCHEEGGMFDIIAIPKDYGESNNRV